MLGTVVYIIYRMWENKSAFAIDDAKTVVSDIGDILSPKYAPDIMAPAQRAGGIPKASPIPRRAIPIVAMVVHEVPVITEMREEIIQAHGRKTAGDIICTP
jgi:hypothetical protein